MIIEQGYFGPYVLEGSSVTLKCTIREETIQEHASEIQFFERSVNDLIPLPNDTFHVINNRTAEITVMNLQRAKHHYLCKLPKQNFVYGGNIFIYVGGKYWTFSL